MRPDAQHPTPPIPARFGEFVVSRVLGSGGGGTVYLARQETLGREVALKVLDSAATETESASEAAITADLAHEHIVKIYGVGCDGTQRFLAMEYIVGASLADLIESARGGLPVRDVLKWGEQIASAIAYAHSKGVIHLDLKPSNIRIDGAGRAVVLDFGLARRSTAMSTRVFAGTPAYAAPEVILGRTDVDARADIYGLGAVLYHALTGRAPVGDGRIDRMLRDAMLAPPLPLRTIRRAVPRALEIVTLKAIEKDRARRYSSAAELAADLAAVREFRPIAARAAPAWLRVANWARRRPALAMSLVTLAAVSVACIAWSVSAARARRAALVFEQNALLREVESVARDYSVSLVETRKHARVSRLHDTGRYLTASEDAEIAVAFEALDAHRAQQERWYYRGLDVLQRAEAIPIVDRRLGEVRALLEVCRAVDLKSQDRYEAELHRQRAVRQGLTPAAREVLCQGARLKLRGLPPGARVHLFRLELESALRADGEPRRVYVPYRGAPPIRPGTFALRVVRGADEIEVGDLILEVAGHAIRGAVIVATSAGEIERFDRVVAIDGAPVERLLDLESNAEPESAGSHRYELVRGQQRYTIAAARWMDSEVEVVEAKTLAERGDVPARVWTRGSERLLTLPRGLELRVTAAPLPMGEASFVGVAPLEEFVLEPGSYVALLVVDGSPLVRVGIPVPPDEETEIDLELPRLIPAPESCVYLPQDRAWLMEREVTMREYLEFLRSRPEAGSVPRDRQGRTPHLTARGDWSLPKEWSEDWPAFGVSWHDAKAYAAWKSAEAQAAGSSFIYELPILFHFTADRNQLVVWQQFSYGDAFRPEWVSSRFYTPKPRPVSVMSAAIDETTHGVYDITGSMSEWLENDYPTGEGRKYVFGGNWDAAVYDQFSWARGMPPTERRDTIGFRLAVRVPE
ncbi:MAG: bifunctional serine/threonine-protein kinase/formylglycine-generating enzyme family protein [Planctomycetota bacterium]